MHNGCRGENSSAQLHRCFKRLVESHQTIACSKSFVVEAGIEPAASVSGGEEGDAGWSVRAGGRRAVGGSAGCVRPVWSQPPRSHTTIRRQR